MGSTKEITQEITQQIRASSSEVVSWEFDLSNIPDSYQFGNAKVEKRFSFFKFCVFICWITIGICAGVILSYLLISFC